MTPRKTLAALASAALLSGFGTQVNASGNDFDNQDVRGAYGFSFIGTIASTPISSAGEFVSDGRGNIAGSRAVNFNGAVLQQTFTCRYSVNPNGTFSGPCVISPGGTNESFVGVIVDNGKTLHYIAVNPGVVVRAIANKQ